VVSQVSCDCELGVEQTTFLPTDRSHEGDS